MNIEQQFEQLLDALGQKFKANPAGDKVISYLTFPPEQMQEVKGKMDQFISLARHRGYEVERLSLAEVILEHFATDPFREQFGKVNSRDELTDVYHALGESLRNADNQVLETQLLAAQARAETKKNGILFITELEALHPFLRFGSIEQNVYSRLSVPMIVFYPGERTGSALKFFGFYPPDGNYRSRHF